MNNIKTCNNGDVILVGYAWLNDISKAKTLVDKYNPKSFLGLKSNRKYSTVLKQQLKSQNVGFKNIHVSEKNMGDEKVIKDVLDNIGNLPKPLIINCNTTRRASAVLALYEALTKQQDLKASLDYAHSYDLLYTSDPVWKRWVYQNAPHLDPTLPAYQCPPEIMSKRKQKFLKTLGKENYGYGNHNEIDIIREKDFKRMQDQVYLDYTGSGQYRESQIRNAMFELENTLFGNSHSHSPSSLATEYELNKARKLILDFFNADENEYSVVFTSGATGALKIVGECFPFTRDSEFCFLNVNHNSVVGIREYAYAKGAQITSFTEEEVKVCMSGCCEHQLCCEGKKAVCHCDLSKLEQKEFTDNSPPNGYLNNKNLPNFNLFCYPAEDNFCGVKYPLDWIDRIENTGFRGKKHWKVCLDAAAFVPTQKLDLSKIKPSFLDISFYKMFGYPSGLGCLIARNDSLPLLQRQYFGGGTVILATVKKHYVEFSRKRVSRFEDGTLSFLAIASLKYGFEAIKDLGIQNIEAHTYSLSRYLYKRLANLKHYNNTSVLKIFGKFKEENERKVQGPIVSFVAFDSRGKPIGYNRITGTAADAGMHIRSGAHCNPGGVNMYLDLSEEQVEKYAHQKTSCGDEMDIRDGCHLGSIRVSVGAYSTFEDIERFCSWFEKTYVDSSQPHSETSSAASTDDEEEMQFFI